MTIIITTWKLLRASLINQGFTPQSIGLQIIVLHRPVLKKDFSLPETAPFTIYSSWFYLDWFCPSTPTDYGLVKNIVFLYAPIRSQIHKSWSPNHMFIVPVWWLSHYGLWSVSQKERLPLHFYWVVII